MINYKKYITFLRLVLLAMIFINIYSKYSNDTGNLILLSSTICILIINDCIRTFKLKNNVKYHSSSIFFTILLTGILQYFMTGIISSICMYSLLFYIIDLHKKTLKIFLSIHAVIYFLINILTNDINTYVNLNMNLLAYIATVGMLYNLKILEIQKEEVKELNQELKSANIKLQEYSSQIEESTILKERTRVSQELHDSLGHSLMALAMHLEFAEKIFLTKPEKVHDVLLQSEQIAKSSIKDLRKAVTVLNSNTEIKDFDASVDKPINNFHLFNNLKINLNKNGDINKLSPSVKTALYKIVQESITNSLKHGNSTEINIHLKIIKHNLEFIITDNGKGCNNIIKSNGLNGIENRINSLGGTTYYFSRNNLGFGIKMIIPI